MADISIPEGDNPVRYQASLGGNQKYRNMGNISGQAYLVRGQVTNVYYQKGTLDFNTYGSSITSGTTDGSGSAPIPVDFWGKNTDGKVFGCYRPVQKGSQILVAYIGGDTSRPIVVGVYPDNESSYELISPVHYNTGDDSTDDVQNDALGERKIYPNQQMMYESGKGDILRSMGGKSFLYISENGSGYLDDINYAYDEISDFYDADANEIEPTMTKAQSWLLVHEDNDSDEAADGHRTRFYVNRSGELMVTFANKEDPNEIVVLEASKDSGFKLTKRFDNSNLKEGSEDYVQFGIGNGNNVSIKSVDSGDATSFYLDNGNIKLNTPKEGSITFDGTSVNDLLGKISDVESAANEASDKADTAATAGEIAKSAASDAASQALAASYAGEDAKSAAVNAQAAGEDAKAQAKDTQDRIIYYASISNEKDVAVPGKYIIVNTDTYIANGTIKTAHIGDGAITNAKIANLAVGNAQLEDAAITRAKIGNLAVGTAQIEDLAITDAKVGDLSANHLKAGTIDFSVISGIHINASEIDVGKIVADQIYVNGLGDISKNLGTVTSGKITGTNINDDVDNVTSDVNDLNDPNIMNVIEKQTVSSQYAGLTSQYNVILDRAKDDGINTADLTTAYTNLNNFITPLLKDTTKASNIDRYTYNSLTYYYNTALSNVQAALKDAYNTDISNMQSSVAVASQAASSAVIVASQAATTGDNASYVAAQAAAVASQAQIAGDNATSVANNASQAASDAVIAGSTAAVKGDKALSAASQAQIAGDNATSVANNASQAASNAVIAGSTAAVNANKAISAASQAQIAGDNATSVANTASQAASGAVLAGSTATVNANKALTAANQAKSAGDNATSVANNATSIANSAKSAADSTYDYANSEIAVQSNATAKAQSTADNAFSQAQAVGSQADSEIAVNSMATAKAQSTADNAFSQAQAVGSQASSEIALQSTATAKAQSTADNAFSQAQAVGSQVSAEISNNSTATAKAQSTADNAFSQATTAIDNGKITSQAVTDLKDGSKLTIADLENGLATKVANSDYASYKEQTASQIGQMVTNGAFSAYQTQTAGLISQKVANSDFSAYQATTAKAIESKVDNGDFSTYKTQTTDLIDDKVSSSEYASDKTQTASEIADRVSNSAFSTYQTQTASQIASKVDNGDFSTYKTQTAGLIAQKVANSDFSAYQATTAKEISSKVESSDFNTYKTQTANMISSKVSSTDFNNLKISNRNLALGTATSFTITGNNTTNQSQDIYKFSKTIPSQTVVTVSFDIASTTGVGKFTMQFDANDSGSSWQAIANNNDLVNGTKHVSVTLTTNANQLHAFFRLDNATGIVTVSNFIISESSKEVSWTPAPEDQATESQITQLSGEIDQKVSNSDYASYKEQTASQIGQMVTNGAFSAYQQTTADLIASKVATKDFSAYQATTAKAIESKVESSDFNTYKTQTADLIDDKVSSSAYASDKTQTASEIADRVSNSAFSTYQNQTASQISQLVTNGAFSAYQQTTADLIASKVANSDFSAYQATTAKAISSKVESSDFNTYKTQTADLIDDKVSSSAYASDKTQTASQIANMVSNSAFSTYQNQTASQIASKVDNGAFSTYKTQTAGLIAQKVATSDFSAYQATTAKAISSKVESSDFNTYKTQTADAISSKVESSDFQALQTQVDNSAVGTNLLLNTSDYSTNWTWVVTPSIDTTQKPAILHYPSTTITSGNSTIAQQNIGTILQPSTTYTASFYAKGTGNFKFYCYPGVAATASSVNGTVVSSTSADCNTTIPLTSSYKLYTITFTTLSNIGNTKNFLLRQDYNTSDTSFNTVEAYVYGMKLEKGGVATDWSINPADQATQSQITQLSGEIDLRVTKGDLVDQINVQAGKTLISSSGQLILSGNSVLLDSVNPVIMKSANIGNLAVGTAQIANGAITNAQIGSLAVDTANIKDAAISSGKIANLAVGTAQIGDGAITNAKIGNLAVGTAQIANGAITNAQIGSLAVDTANIKDAAISSGKIANLAVGTAQIGNGAITTAKIGNLAVGTAQIANGAITNAQIGSLAVDTSNIKDAAINSAKIANLAVGTAQIGNGAITNAKIANLAVGTAQIANAAITDAQVGNVSANKLTAGTIDFNTITGKNINASNITTGTLSTDRLNVGTLSALSADLGKVTTGTLTGVDIVANSFSTPDGSFTTHKDGSVVASNLTIRGVTNLVYNAALLGANGSSIPGWNILNNGTCWPGNTHDGVPSIGFNASTGANVWAIFAQTKLHPLNGNVYQPFSASVWFQEYGSDTSLLYQLTLAFFDSNGNRINGGFTGNTWNGIGSGQDWRYITIENVTPPSNAVSVGLQYWAYNGHGNACFSSPMLTQTAQSTGYQPDTGNVVNAGIINGSTISAGTINGTTINGSTINGSTIIGGALNMQTDGLINSPYTGIQQTADQFYHPWKLNTGQLTIGQGYITSVSSGTRSINGVPKQFNSLQGTLSASYLKFTNDYGARTYIDADMFTYSNQTNDTAMVAISASGIGINMGTSSAPALTISNGYIDASSSSSYGKFGAMIFGYSAHTINSDSSLFFESGYGSGNPGINIWAKGFQSLSSRLSTKRQVRLLDDEHSNSLLLGADTATFQYNQDTNADNSNEGVIIDDVNTVKQYNLPDELITRDGKAPTDLMSFIARVISQNKYQARLIEDLQIRLRKVEINNEQ